MPRILQSIIARSFFSQSWVQPFLKNSTPKSGRTGEKVAITGPLKVSLKYVTKLTLSAGIEQFRQVVIAIALMSLWELNNSQDSLLVFAKMSNTFSFNCSCQSSCHFSPFSTTRTLGNMGALLWGEKIYLYVNIIFINSQSFTF